ncbi:hypothetical protein DL93DRAFT_370476 [Clavulina sp. PMI_390]|nr:hypothetical protein DL93DRAFT_370476 [Clavulina sp. PMI_390]
MQGGHTSLPRSYSRIWVGGRNLIPPPCVCVSSTPPATFDATRSELTGEADRPGLGARREGLNKVRRASNTVFRRGVAVRRRAHPAPTHKLNYSDHTRYAGRGESAPAALPSRHPIWDGTAIPRSLLTGLNSKGRGLIHHCTRISHLASGLAVVHLSRKKTEELHVEKNRLN